MKNFHHQQWAIILGGSSGFGLATAKKLSAHGMNIALIHRDRQGSMARIEEEFTAIKRNGTKFFSMNTDALSSEGRNKIIDKLKEEMGGDGKVRLLLHSIAFGNLKPIAPAPKETESDLSLSLLASKLGIPQSELKKLVVKAIEENPEGTSPLNTLLTSSYSDMMMNEEDMAQTIYSMGTSYLSWVQDLQKQNLFENDARVIGLTSEGNEVAWRGYAAVAAAKVALESLSRSIALEFAPFGLRSNIVQPGVTPTPALKLIPGSGRMEAMAKMRNPFKRTTRPEDVANVIALLCTDEAAWINGSLIRVDGGEHITSI